MARAFGQRRGDARRAALVAAVIRLLASEGARGVTHRAVAKIAGTAHGAARYYFATSEDMLAAALEELVRAQVVEVEAFLALTPAGPETSSADRLAAFLLSRQATDRDGEVARYELFLEAARRPRLRPALAAWGAAYERLLGEHIVGGDEAPRADGALLLALINGLLLQRLALPDSATDLADAIERARRIR